MEVILNGHPAIICPGCQKTTNKGNEFGEKKLCGFCYFGEYFLRKSGNQDIDNFLRKFAERKKYPFLEFIPYEEFSNVIKIGHGEFSQVYKATWNKGCLRNWNKKDGNFTRFPPSTVALKVLEESREMNSEFLKEQQFLNRTSMKAKYKKRFINVYGISQDPVSKNYIFVTIYANHGNLKKCLQTYFSNITWLDKGKLLKNIVEALNLMEKANYIHRNLHSGNILMYSEFPLIDDLEFPMNEKSKKTPKYQTKVRSECQNESVSANLVQSKIISKWLPYEEFSDIEKIGQGRSSQVYKAIRHKQGIKKEREVALRILDESRNLDSEFLKEPQLKFLFSKNRWSTNQCYGISQDPMTMNHILVMSYRPIDLKVYLQANFTKMTWFNKREILNNITEPEQNHPESVYHARLLNTIVEIANSIKNSRDSFNLMKPSAAGNKILVHPEIQDINYFLIRSSNNQAKSILEWIPYEDFSNIERIGMGGFSKVYKAMWQRGHIKHWNSRMGEVVRSEPVEVALKVLDDSADICSTFLNEESKTRNYIFVMQYANYGNLRTLLVNGFNNKVEIIENLDPEELRAAEKIREEMIKYGIQFVEKPGFEHPESVYSSRKLDSFIESSKVILYDSSYAKEMLGQNMKQKKRMIVMRS
ncbi:4180_t:CDS:10 [Acaulospora morrowiae]|uniref:4180_t:CDS:1 n=1 Tax=Acaulospora morrowiae TaxID=94023 RepID=A0A9N8WI15_9GLOM|nr:4180_t:CDS:10 [Acaulospora morrowiae]